MEIRMPAAKTYCIEAVMYTFYSFGVNLSLVDNPGFRRIYLCSIDVKL